MPIKILAGLVVSSCLLAFQSCLPPAPNATYSVDTFEFVPTESHTNDSEPLPSVWINTNTEISGLDGGKLTSHLPCGVMIEFTDNVGTIQSMVITRLAI